jgi:hypothetical protein
MPAFNVRECWHSSVYAPNEGQARLGFTRASESSRLRLPPDHVVRHPFHNGPHSAPCGTTLGPRTGSLYPRSLAEAGQGRRGAGPPAMGASGPSLGNSENVVKPRGSGRQDSRGGRRRITSRTGPGPARPISPSGSHGPGPGGPGGQNSSSPFQSYLTVMSKCWPQRCGLGSSGRGSRWQVVKSALIATMAAPAAAAKKPAWAAPRSGRVRLRPAAAGYGAGSDSQGRLVGSRGGAQQ